MNIILGEDRANELKGRYLVLTLDSFLLPNLVQPVTSYCVIEQMSMEEMATLDSWRSLHENLITSYAQQHWNFCEQAIEHLMGKWNKELDSFYSDLLERVKQLKENEPGQSWSAVIDRRNKDIGPGSVVDSLVPKS